MTRVGRGGFTLRDARRPTVKPSPVDLRGATSTVGAVVALKPTEFAKSRLGTVPDPLRRRIAWTMAVDTLAALNAAVDHVVVVSNQPSLEARLRRYGLSVSVVAEPGRVGMNGALGHGDAVLRADGCTSVLACVGDVPALRPSSVSLVLEASRTYPRSFLADASGVGTTMLVAHGVPLDPHFQGRSAAAHQASGAEPLNLAVTLSDARRDVDTEVDLADAIRLGLGPVTAPLVDPTTGALGRYQVVTVSDQRGPEGHRLAITSDGYRITFPDASLQDAWRSVHTGQRLHAVATRDRVLAAWL